MFEGGRAQNQPAEFTHNCATVPLCAFFTIQPNRLENMLVDGRVQLSAEAFCSIRTRRGRTGGPKGGTAKTAKLPPSLFTKRYQLEIMRFALIRLQ